MPAKKKKAVKKPAKKKAAKKPAKKKKAVKKPAKKKPVAKKPAKKMTISQARGLSQILDLADRQVCSSGKLAHASVYYRRLSEQSQKDFDSARELLRSISTKALSS